MTREDVEKVIQAIDDRDIIFVNGEKIIESGMGADNSVRYLNTIKPYSILNLVCDDLEIKE